MPTAGVAPSALKWRRREQTNPRLICKVGGMPVTDWTFVAVTQGCVCYAGLLIGGTGLTRVPF